MILHFWAVLFHCLELGHTKKNFITNRLDCYVTGSYRTRKNNFQIIVKTCHKLALSKVNKKLFVQRPLNEEILSSHMDKFH